MNTTVRHPDEAYVRPDGMRDLTMEQRVYRSGKVVHVHDHDQRAPVVAHLYLTPEALDFLIDSLPAQDGFTEQLRYARRLAKEVLWEAGR